MFSQSGSHERTPLLGDVARKYRILDLLAIITLPWLLFTLNVCMFTFAFEDFPVAVWVLVGMSIFIAVLLMISGLTFGLRANLTLGYLLAIALGVSIPLGLFIYHRYISEYWRLEDGESYSNVSPVDLSSWRSDAEVLQFDSSATVSINHSIGFVKAGQRYCVAPVIGNQSTAPAYYWAAGIECCSLRGGFTCDDVGKSGARSGVVVHEGDDTFALAAKMAVSIYDLPLQAGSPTFIFVRWTSDPHALKLDLWTGSILWAWISSAVYLLLSGIIGSVIVRHRYRAAAAKSLVALK